VLNLERLFRDLDVLGLGSWQASLASLLKDRFSDKAHGDAPRWKDIIRQLPAAQTEAITPDGNSVVIGADKLRPQASALIRTQLKGLMPWRKGPFDVHGIKLDAEWRSDMKTRNGVRT
jgi:tRNA (mo5U34)-methyltransferase